MIDSAALNPEPLTNNKVCYEASFFNISSYGFFENDIKTDPWIIFTHSLPLLEMQVIVIFILILLSHMFLRSIGIPKFVSYMLAGLILGPQLIDLFGYPPDRLSLYIPGHVALESVGKFGLIMFTFLMGVKTNKRAVFQTGKPTVGIAVSSFMVTMIIGIAFRNFRIDKVDPLYMPLRLAPTERTVIVSIQSLSSLPVVTHLVHELKIPNSELSRIAISIAAINDLLALITLIGVSYIGTYRYVSPTIANRDIMAMIILVLVILFIVRPIAQWIVEHTQEDKPVRELYLYGTIMTAIAASIYTTFFNQISVLGAFMVGLAIPDGPPLGSALEAKFDSLVTNLIFPISITVMTMKSDIIRVIYAFDDISFNIFLVGLILVVKWTASFVPCLICTLPTRESVIIATMMNYKGFVDLCFYNIAAERRNLSKATHTLLIMYVLLNAGILPTILKALYDPRRKYIGYVKRDIMHLKSHSDLKILTCLHKPENISGTISLLQLLSSALSNENKDRGVIAVTVLHLVKLSGRAFPVLIPHDKRSKHLLLENSYIETMMLAFTEFHRENWSSTSINSFTAYSNEDLMDQDICNLALDHLTSMIIVPSGRKWSLDGLYESDDVMIRRVNTSLLDRAPCSVGVLNDRAYRKGKKMASNNVLNVGVIFIGGKDDHEVVSLVKRMRHNLNVCVNVTRFVSGKEPDELKNWDQIVDNEVLIDLRETYYKAENFVYREKIVNSGPAVATTVRVVAEDNDLMIVGRYHDDELLDFTGLVEWMELPELGVIGDLLASKDLRTRVSVLVVQQQRQHG